MINPMKLMKLKDMGARFQANHPRLPAFFDAAVASVQEGSVVEMTVTNPDGKKLFANIRVTGDDMEMLHEAMEAFGQEL